MATFTLANNATFFADLWAIATEVFKVKTFATANYYVVLEWLPRTFTSKGAGPGGNSLGLDGKEDLVCECTAAATASGTADDAASAGFHSCVDKPCE